MFEVNMYHRTISTVLLSLLSAMAVMRASEIPSGKYGDSNEIAYRKRHPNVFYDKVQSFLREIEVLQPLVAQCYAELGTQMPTPSPPPHRGGLNTGGRQRLWFALDDRRKKRYYFGNYDLLKLRQELWTLLDRLHRCKVVLSERTKLWDDIRNQTSLLLKCIKDGGDYWFIPTTKNMESLSIADLKGKLAAYREQTRMCLESTTTTLKPTTSTTTTTTTTTTTPPTTTPEPTTTTPEPTTTTPEPTTTTPGTTFSTEIPTTTFC